MAPRVSLDLLLTDSWDDQSLEERNSDLKFEILEHNGVEVFDYPSEFWFLAPFPGEKGRPFNADNLATVNLAPFIDDIDFQNALRAARERWEGTGMRRDISWRVHILLSFASAAARRSEDGGFVELGLGRGYMLAALLEWERIHGFSFSFHHVFDQAASESDPAMYSHNTSEISDFCEGSAVDVFWGCLPSSLDRRAEKASMTGVKRISFIHVDLNNGPAEIACLDRLQPDLTPDCIILFDDSGNPGRTDQAVLHQDWCRRNGRQLCFLPSGQAVSL